VAGQHYYYHGHSGSAISWLKFSFEKKSRPNSASIGDTAGAVDEDHHYRNTFGKGYGTFLYHFSSGVGSILGKRGQKKFGAKRGKMFLLPPLGNFAGGRFPCGPCVLAMALDQITWPLYTLGRGAIV